MPDLKAMRAGQADKILDFLERSQQDGWRIEIENGIVRAVRVATGGKCGPSTEYDKGIAQARPCLRDGLAHVLQAIVSEVDNARREVSA